MQEQTPSEIKQGFIRPEHQSLSLRRQCELLRVNRSSLYYKSKREVTPDLNLLNEIRDIWMRYPFYGYRRITWALRQKGFKVNHKRVQRLMNLGRIHAIYPGPNTSRRNKKHTVHPYLLKGIQVTAPNQAWMVDITYLRMDKGFVYLSCLDGCLQPLYRGLALVYNTGGFFLHRSSGVSAVQGKALYRQYGSRLPVYQ